MVITFHLTPSFNKLNVKGLKAIKRSKQILFCVVFLSSFIPITVRIKKRIKKKTGKVNFHIVQDGRTAVLSRFDADQGYIQYALWLLF